MNIETFVEIEKKLEIENEKSFVKKYENLEEEIKNYLKECNISDANKIKFAFNLATNPSFKVTKEERLALLKTLNECDFNEYAYKIAGEFFYENSDVKNSKRLNPEELKKLEENYINDSFNKLRRFSDSFYSDVLISRYNTRSVKDVIELMKTLKECNFNSNSYVVACNSLKSTKEVIEIMKAFKDSKNKAYKLATNTRILKFKTPKEQMDLINAVKECGFNENAIKFALLQNLDDLNVLASLEDISTEEHIKLINTLRECNYTNEAYEFLGDLLTRSVDERIKEARLLKDFDFNKTAEYIMELLERKDFSFEDMKKIIEKSAMYEYNRLPNEIIKSSFVTTYRTVEEIIKLIDYVKDIDFDEDILCFATDYNILKYRTVDQQINMMEIIKNKYGKKEKDIAILTNPSLLQFRNLEEQLILKEIYYKYKNTIKIIQNDEIIQKTTFDEHIKLINTMIEYAMLSLNNIDLQNISTNQLLEVLKIIKNEEENNKCKKLVPKKENI